MDQEEVDYYNSINLAKTKAEAQKNHYRKNPVPGRTWTPHWSHYWEPPEGSTYGSDPYLCSRCADTDQKLVPAVIRTADISGYHHAGTDAVMEKTESGWEMTEPIQEYTIADIKDAADSFGDNKTGYCKDCWIAQGNYGALEVMNKKLFGAEDTPLLYDEEFYKSMATSNDYDGRLYCKECLKLGVETDPIVGVLDLTEAADWGVIIYNEGGGAYWSLDEPSGWAKKGLIPPWSDHPGNEDILDYIKGAATSEGYWLRHWEERAQARQRRKADFLAKSRAKYGSQPWNKEAEGESKPPTNTPPKAVLIIDNSGSTAVEDTGIKDKKTGHRLTRLDRHILTAGAYLGAFPDSGEYRIITPSFNFSPDKKCWVEDFDNTDDAIDYLFTLTPSGPGFNFPSDEILRLSKDYGNVLLIQDEPLL